ncbi:hypothetical protein F4604DRAFT_1927999 [Suillus subluteus]|nr:hypothetical protein F4604DRAFT_1927999 [Suillus subluteus]
MPSQPAATPVAHCTRPTNANVHPGAILLQAKKSRRTSEQVSAARDEKVAQAAAQAAAIEAGAKCVAGIELEMEAKQMETLTRKAKGIRPCLTPYKSKKAVKGALDDKDEVPMDINDGEVNQDSYSKVKKKVTKVSMKDAVNQAHNHLKATVDGRDKAARVDIKKGNLLGTAKKPEFALTNKVENWVSGVRVNTSIKSQDPSHVTHTSASPLPSTIFSHLTGSSRTTHSVLLADIPKGPLEAHVPGGALVGGFSDGEDGDNELERLATHGITAKEGRLAAAVTVTLTVDNSDEEFEVPAEFRAPFTQLSPKSPSKAATASILKRKASEGLDLVSGSEIEDFSDNAFDNTMDIDVEDYQKDKTKLEKPKPKFEKTKTKLEKPPRTTTSTSVITVDTKTTTTKKAKVESLLTSLGDTLAAKEQQSATVNTLHSNLKPRAQYRNTDLPEQVQADHHWAKKFLLTMMLWAGSQESLWSIPDATLLTHIQIAFKVVYPEVNIAVVLNGAIFSLTVQRLSEWQSNFGSTAIVIIIDFLTSNQECDSQVLAGLLLKNFAFIFEDMDGCDPASAFLLCFHATTPWKGSS